MPRGSHRENKSVGGSKGVCPLGRRARVHTPPEKGEAVDLMLFMDSHRMGKDT
jgi:hypothetical protein